MSSNDLETEEKNGLKYFWWNTIPVQGKNVQVFPSFHRVFPVPRRILTAGKRNICSLPGLTPPD